MLAALSQRTSRVGLGQLVTCSSYRNAGLLAKETACIDVYSNGRLILGLGAGWFHEEYASYGYPYLSNPERLAALDETLEVVQRLWAEETVTFHGDHLHFEGAYCDPKPVQERPPVLVGGGGEKVNLRIAARRADLTNWQVGLEAFRRKSDLLAGYCAEVGRPFEAIRRTHGPDCRLFDSERRLSGLVRVRGRGRPLGRDPDRAVPGRQPGGHGGPGRREDAGLRGCGLRRAHPVAARLSERRHPPAVHGRGGTGPRGLLTGIDQREDRATRERPPTRPARATARKRPAAPPPRPGDRGTPRPRWPAARGHRGPSPSPRRPSPGR